MKWVLLGALVVALSGCATGRFCVDDSQVKYNVLIGEGKAPKLEHWWDCYSEADHSEDLFHRNLKRKK